MNRCTAFTLKRLSALAALLVLSVSATAQLAIRPFPPGAQRGAMLVTAAPELLLNGKPERLSPGARIRGSNNMLVLSAALTGQDLLVNYTREPHGLIHEVWILNAAEAQIPLVARP